MAFCKVRETPQKQKRNSLSIPQQATTVREPKAHADIN
jgi:hypothetical protein